METRTSGKDWGIKLLTLNPQAAKSTQFYIRFFTDKDAMYKIVVSLVLIIGHVSK